jgi:predicted transcriptional regulator
MQVFSNEKYPGGFNPQVLQNFIVRSVMTNVLSWELANQYLNSLKRIGYARKEEHSWSITQKGLKYHSRFMQEFIRIHQRPFSWR